VCRYRVSAALKGRDGTSEVAGRISADGRRNSYSGTTHPGQDTRARGQGISAVVAVSAEAPSASLKANLRPPGSDLAPVRVICLLPEGGLEEPRPGTTSTATTHRSTSSDAGDGGLVVVVYPASQTRTRAQPELRSMLRFSMSPDLTLSRTRLHPASVCDATDVNPTGPVRHHRVTSMCRDRPRPHATDGSPTWRVRIPTKRTSIRLGPGFPGLVPQAAWTGTSMAAESASGMHATRFSYP
jgi:hypothetical protein